LIETDIFISFEDILLECMKTNIKGKLFLQLV